MKRKEWNLVYKDLTRLRIVDYVNGQLEMLKEKRQINSIAMLDSKLVDMASDKGYDTVMNSNLPDNDTEVIDMTSDKATVSVILGKDVNMVAVNALVQKRKISERSRERKLKKRSVRKGALVSTADTIIKPGMIMT